MFADNQLAIRCASILDEILLPGYLTSSEHWSNFEMESWPMDFNAWPAEGTDDFFTVLGYPTSNLGI